MIFASIFVFLLSFSILVQSNAIEAPIAKKIVEAAWTDPNIVCCQKKPDSSDTYWLQVDHSKDPTPPPIYDNKHTKNDTTILILVASLRETLLAKTLYSFYKNASFPNRVHFAIVQQNAATDKDILQEYCALIGKPIEKIENSTDPHEFQYLNPNNCEEVDRIRVLRLLDTEAKGPAYARGRGNELVNHDHDFCMQIDAHTVVAKDWDILLMDQWASINNEFAIISTYPPEPDGLMKNSNNHWEMPHLCCVDMAVEKGVFHNCQAKAAANMVKPLLAPLWAAGLSFSKCHAERLVPNDPGLKHIFSGEEFSRAARFWTHGYDFYSMSRPVVTTWYGHKKGGKGGWQTNNSEYRASVNRMQTMLQVDISDQSQEAIQALGIYTLGNRRSLEQYINFSGVDPIRGTFIKDPGLCEVHYVPWDDSGLRRRVAIGGMIENGDLKSDEDIHIPKISKQKETKQPDILINKNTEKKKPRTEPDYSPLIYILIFIVAIFFCKKLPAIKKFFQSTFSKKRNIV